MSTAPNADRRLSTAMPIAGGSTARDVRSPRRSLATIGALIGVTALTLSIPTLVIAAPGDIPGRGFLPDNRGWEKVSPVAKNGLNAAETGSQATRYATDKMTFILRGPAPGTLAGGVASMMMASRDPLHGWSSQPIDPPVPDGHFQVALAGYTNFSADLSKAALLSTAALTADSTPQANQAYIRDNSTGSYRLTTPVAGDAMPFPISALNGFLLHNAGVSDDYSHVLYESAIAQTEDAVAPDYTTYNAYEWVDGAGVRLVGVLPDGTIPQSGSKPGSGWFTGSQEHALSRDGGRAFFHVIESGQEVNFSSAGQLLVREDGSVTKHASASRRTDCAGDASCGGDGVGDPAPDPAGPLPALFLTAEAERGDRVLFTSCEKLTDDSTASLSHPTCAGGDGVPYRFGEAFPGRDLYEFDVVSGVLRDLTTEDVSGADVFGVVGASDDLERVYFVAGGVLDSGAVDGAPNLYVRAGGVTRFVATLTDEDRENWSSAPWEKVDAARVTPDGGHVLVTSRASLTGYDNASTECTGGRCSEVYLYDLEADKLTCVSCDPRGEAAEGDAEPMSFRFANQSSDPLPRNVLEDGSAVFFQTHDGLVPQDVNGKQDVYVWKKDGGVRLLSSGTGSADSYFADASASGDDAFFLTYDRLTVDDVDDFVDMYDARVDGGFPEPEPPAPGCEGDGCQGPPSDAPSVGAGPGSARFFGAGDLPSGRQTAGFKVASLSVVARRKFARTGRVALRVRVPKGGRIAARSNRGRGTQLVAKGAGTKRLVLRLSSRSRRVLRERGRLSVRITVRFDGATRTTTVTLRSAK